MHSTEATNRNNLIYNHETWLFSYGYDQRKLHNQVINLKILKWYPAWIKLFKFSMIRDLKILQNHTDKNWTWNSDHGLVKSYAVLQIIYHRFCIYARWRYVAEMGTRNSLHALMWIVLLFRDYIEII